ncbi:MAG: hypothetical protein HY587_02940 [Candidatus Omnitrophica bacterium]|nr:hypothetical protein [Candidatus Omnitrophota bacterium]
MIFRLIVLLTVLVHSTAFAGPLMWKDVNVWTHALAQSLGHPLKSGEEGNFPGAEDVQLLEQFKPRIYVAPEGAKPVDFYADYLPYTVVRRATEKDLVKERAPERDRLKEFIFNPEYYLEYQGPGHPESSTPKAYGRVSFETVNLTVHGLITSFKFKFLRYHYVFLYGGLPMRLASYKEVLVPFALDPEKWRELEHSSVYVVLDEADRVVAVMLGQYDHFRTYVAGRKDLVLPPDGRVRIAFSLRSNQPYLFSDGQSRIQRFASLDFREIPYLIGQAKEPLLGGIDIIYPPGAGGREVDYRLEFLPEFDPLYISRIPLGRRVYLFDRVENPLRRGSIGIDFCTWPQLVELGNQMQFWFILDGDPKQARFMREHMRGFFDVDFSTILHVNAEAFGRAMSENAS